MREPLVYPNATLRYGIFLAMSQNQPKFGRFRRVIRAIWYGLRVLIVILLIILFTKPEWPAYGEQRTQILRSVGLRQFDFVNFWLKTGFLTN